MVWRLAFITLFYLSGLLVFQPVSGAGYIKITNLPADVTIYEDESPGTFVFSVVYFKTSSVDPVTCWIDDTANFDTTKTTDGIDISVASGNSLDYDGQNPVPILVTCDLSGTTDAETLSVTLTENTAPYFTNGNDFGTATVSAKTTKADDVVLKLEYSDDDDTKPLQSKIINSVSPTPDPDPNVFVLADDFITVKEALIKYNAVGTYTLSITISDGRTPLTGDAFINIIDRNTPPEFVTQGNALEDKEIFPEFTEGRLLLYDIDFLDAEGDAVTMKDVGSDTNISTYFDLVPTTGEIYLLGGQMLDYEVVPKFVFEVTIEDYLEVYTSTFTLTIVVSNVNEQPTFNATPSEIRFNESPKGTVIGELGALCTDPDDTSPQYTILTTANSEYFGINDLAVLSFRKDFDYDDPNLANEVNLTIRCFDDGGLSDDTIITIIILDVNDNDPFCSPSISSFNLKYNQAVNETIVNVDCTDADSNKNAELDYEIIGFSSGYSKVYFQVDEYGNVSISQEFQMDYNTSFYVTVVVTDRGTPSRTDTVTLSITYTEEPLVLVYEEVTECFLCTTSALTLIAAAGLTVFMLVTCGIVLTVLRCCYDRERIKIERTLTKKKKTSWRCCGCLRPGKQKKPKAKKEVVLAENRDQEYMRARNALGLDDQQAPGPSTASTGPPLSKVRRHGRKPVSSGSTGAQNATLLGRDQTPDISATPVDKMGLTPSQKKQLAKFEEMKRSNAADGPSTSKQGQAGGKMVWAFNGR